MQLHPKIIETGSRSFWPPGSVSGFKRSPISEEHLAAQSFGNALTSASSRSKWPKRFSKLYLRGLNEKRKQRPGGEPDPFQRQENHILEDL